MNKYLKFTLLIGGVAVGGVGLIALIKELKSSTHRTEDYENDINVQQAMFIRDILMQRNDKKEKLMQFAPQIKDFTGLKKEYEKLFKGQTAYSVINYLPITYSSSGDLIVHIRLVLNATEFQEFTRIVSSQTQINTDILNKFIKAIRNTDFEMGIGVGIVTNWNNKVTLMKDYYKKNFKTTSVDTTYYYLKSFGLTPELKARVKKEDVELKENIPLLTNKQI